MNTSISRACRTVYHQCLHKAARKKSLPAVFCPLLYKTFATNRTMSSKLDNIAKRLAGTEKNVWVEFSGLVREHKAINLGQGFPDFMPPDYLAKEMRNVADSDNPLVWQYSRSFGHPRLVSAVAECYGKVMGRELNPNTEILISNGAYGCLFATIQGLVNPGEEVIIIEPYFDCYEPMVRVAGGKPVFIPLQPTKKGEQISSNDWKLDPNELASKFNSNTKAIILNTPNNPLGKVFNMEEIQMVADLCKKHDVLCIADEVYEWMVYDDSKHIKIATLPGMWERTVTIGSAGKTFSATGLKLGWAVAPQRLMRGLQILHQNCLYLLPTPAQEAVARCFEHEIPQMDKPECYFNAISEELKPKRDNLARMLSELGMMPTIPDGGYFMIADISNFAKLDLPLDDTDDPFDFKFVRWMTKEKKLSAIPPSAFYSKEHKHLADKFIRFCFIKNDSTLEKAAKILKEWKDTL